MSNPDCDRNSPPRISDRDQCWSRHGNSQTFAAIRKRRFGLGVCESSAANELTALRLFVNAEKRHSDSDVSAEESVLNRVLDNEDDFFLNSRALSASQYPQKSFSYCLTCLFQSALADRCKSVKSSPTLAMVQSSAVGRLPDLVRQRAILAPRQAEPYCRRRCIRVLAFVIHPLSVGPVAMTNRPGN